MNLDKKRRAEHFCAGFSLHYESKMKSLKNKQKLHLNGHLMFEQLITIHHICL